MYYVEQYDADGIFLNWIYFVRFYFPELSHTRSLNLYRHFFMSLFGKDNHNSQSYNRNLTNCNEMDLFNIIFKLTCITVFVCLPNIDLCLSHGYTILDLFWVSCLNSAWVAVAQVFQSPVGFVYFIHPCMLYFDILCNDNCVMCCQIMTTVHSKTL